MKRQSLHDLYKIYKAIWLKKLWLTYKKKCHPRCRDKSTLKKDKKRCKKKRKRLVHSRQVRIDKGLLQAIRRLIQHTSSEGKPIYTSVSSFIRDALTEYQQGLNTASGTETERQITTVRLDDELNAFWSTLPRSKRLDTLKVILHIKLGDDSCA